MACFCLVSALRAKLLVVCIEKSAHMVEMHYFPLTYTTSLFPLYCYLHTYLVYILGVFTLDPWANASIAQALDQSDHGMILLIRVSAYRVY